MVKKNTVNLVIALSLVSLAGVLLLQVLWLRQATHNNRNLADRAVNEALNETVAALEKNTVHREFNRHISIDSFGIGRVELFKFDSVDTSINTAGSLVQVRSIVDSHRTVSNNKQVITIKKDSMTFITQRVDSIVNEILSDIELGKDAAINEGLYRGIDSIFEKSLEQRGMHNHFDYALKDGQNTVLYKSPDFDTSRWEYVYAVGLHPLRINGPDIKLVVAMRNMHNYVVHSLWPFFVSSIVFTAIIVMTFGMAIRTILKQKKLSEIKNDFINNMTHEFKTPIATISIAADAMKADMPPAEQTKYFAGIIKQESRHMNQKVESILQMALLDKQLLKPEFSIIDINEIIKASAERMKLQMEQTQARIEFELNALKTIIMGDEEHLTNVFANILDNAIKYSAGAPQISVITNNTAGSIIISISDKGIGMTKEEQKKIFERFYRATKGNLHNTKGFGLGLSYAKEIISLHGGEIKVKSEKGTGSTFDIILPLA